MTDQDITKVVFRKFKGGEVIAIFPEIPYNDNSLGICESYMHVGQHGACDTIGISSETTLATPDEYASLKRELESAPYHYNFKVMKRIRHGHY